MSKIEKTRIRFGYANEDRVIHVYLPDGYEEHTDERYPVMYMWDGQNMFLDSDATFGKSSITMYSLSLLWFHQLSAWP